MKVTIRTESVEGTTENGGQECSNNLEDRIQAVATLRGTRTGCTGELRSPGAIARPKEDEAAQKTARRTEMQRLTAGLEEMGIPREAIAEACAAQDQEQPKKRAAARDELLKGCLEGTSHVLDFIERLANDKQIVWAVDPMLGIRGSLTGERPRTVRKTAADGAGLIGRGEWLDDGLLRCLCPLGADAEARNPHSKNGEAGEEAHEAPFETAWTLFKNARDERGLPVSGEAASLDDIGRLSEEEGSEAISWGLLVCASDHNDVQDWMEGLPELSVEHANATAQSERAIRSWMSAELEPEPTSEIRVHGAA